MAKSIAKSCPLCLSVNDPADMLPVTMEHSTPPQTAPLYLCRLCVIQIMKSTLQSDVVDPSEVFGADVSGNSEVRASEIAPSSSPETPAISDAALQQKADDARAEWLVDQEQERASLHQLRPDDPQSEGKTMSGEICVACSIGHHQHCGMQTWCECEHGHDGSDPDGRETCHACDEAQEMRS